ncbi:MAG: hypothetical protein GXP29_11630, partial [Planctomycetes bacterium]|nr:hypothetical protein [Planctomycetota bacterium]
MILASTMLAQVLAQEGGTSYENIAYLVMFLILPLLNWLASKYKDWQAGDNDASDQLAGSDEEVVFDVSLDDDDEFVLRPASAERTASAAPAIPVAQPTLRPPTLPRPAAPRQPAPRQPTQPTQRPPVAAKTQAKRRSSAQTRASQSKRAVKKTKPRP